MSIRNTINSMIGPSTRAVTAANSLALMNGEQAAADPEAIRVSPQQTARQRAKQSLEDALAAKRDQSRGLSERLKEDKNGKHK